MTGAWHDDCWIGDADEHHGAGAIDEQTALRLKRDLGEIERRVIDDEDPPLGARFEDAAVGMILGASLATLFFVYLLLSGRAG